MNYNNLLHFSLLRLALTSVVSGKLCVVIERDTDLLEDNSLESRYFTLGNFLYGEKLGISTKK